MLVLYRSTRAAAQDHVHTHAHTIVYGAKELQREESGQRYRAEAWVGLSFLPAPKGPCRYAEATS